jgi:uncharacterized membrane protein
MKSTMTEENNTKNQATTQAETQAPSSQNRRRRRRKTSRKPDAHKLSVTTPQKSEDASPVRTHQVKPEKGKDGYKHRNQQRNFSSKPIASDRKSAVIVQKEVNEILLPSAVVLQEFEYALEGGAERVFEMAKSEQLHRHEKEMQQLKSQIKSQRFGLLFGVIIALFSLYLMKILADSGDQSTAVLVVLVVFAAIIISGLLGRILR